MPHIPGLHGVGLPVAGIAVFVVAGLLVLQDQHGKKGKSGMGGSGANAAIEQGVDTVLRLVGRYISGRPLSGESRSNATFWRAGVPVFDMESPAASVGERPRPAVSLVKSGSTPTAWPVVVGVVRAVGRGVLAAGRSLVSAAVGFRRWPRVAVAVLRVVVPGAVAVWVAVPGERVLLVAGLAVLLGVAVVTVVTGPGGLGWRRGRVIGDDERYGPSLWHVVSRALRLEEGERRQEWLTLPFELSAEGAVITLRLPQHFIGVESERKALNELLHARVPGEWVGAWQTMGDEHRVRWTRKPAPKAVPKLPSRVSWVSSGTPHKVFVGQTVDDFEVVDQYVFTQTETPHWGVAGDTGSGKSTLLYIPIVHARQHGWVVDVLDTKRNSLILAEGYSGVRIHKTTRSCIGTFAEFMVSMMAAEKAVGKDGDPAAREQLVPRLLVIDELPTLIRFAYTWWKYGIKQKGAPPFIDWLTIILMMGRSSNHRVVVGTQQFDNALFGGTIGRKQIGTKIVVGRQDMVSWGVAFGQNTPRFGYDTEVKGRGAYADNRTDPGGADFVYVREFQAAYISPEVPELLDECPKTPAWFDRGEMAPWVTADDLAQGQEEAATADFMPGGRFAPQRVSPASDGGMEGGRRRSGGDTSSGDTGVDTGVDTAQAGGGVASEDAEDAALPRTYSLPEACELGILPMKYNTARIYLQQRSEKRGVKVPEGIITGQVTYYTEAELRKWLSDWRASTRK